MAAVALTIVCSTLIALILKWNENLKASALYLLLGNYLTATLISLFLWLHQQPIVGSWPSLGFGLVLGLLFVYAFFAFTQAVRAAGAALATVSARLSVAIPILFSILLFAELPGKLQSLGLGFVALTMFFFYLSLKTNSVKPIRWQDFFYLFILWLGIGLNDFSLKIFQNWRGTAEKPFFLLIIFSSAFVYTWVAIRLQKIGFDKTGFVLGLFLGIPNLFSAFFLISALQALPAVVVYPTVNLGIIVLTAVASHLIWQEKLNPAGFSALASGIVAILLLNWPN